MENMTIIDHDVILVIINDITRMKQHLDFMGGGINGVPQQRTTYMEYTLCPVSNGI